MSIIVENGSGVSNANSYMSVASCTEYLNSKGLTTWGTASTGQEVSLVQACLYMELLTWKGQKALSDYVLAWPRRGILDREGFVIYSNVVPKDIRKAQCELAYRFMNGKNPFADIEAGEAYIATETVGPVTTEYSQPHDVNPKFPEVKALLEPFLSTDCGPEVERC